MHRLALVVVQAAVELWLACGSGGLGVRYGESCSGAGWSVQRVVLIDALEFVEEVGCWSWLMRSVSCWRVAAEEAVLMVVANARGRVDTFGAGCWQWHTVSDGRLLVGLCGWAEVELVVWGVWMVQVCFLSCLIWRITSVELVDC